MTCQEDLLKAVEREVVAEFEGDGQRGDDRRVFTVAFAHIFGAHGAAAQEAGGPVVELLADFLSDPPPRGGLGEDFVRLDEVLFDRQVFGQARLARLRGARSGVLRERRLPRVSARAGARGGGRFSQSGLLFGKLEQQLQLRGIQFLTAFAKDFAHQFIHLFPQQFVLCVQAVVFRQRALQLRGERRDRPLHLFQMFR